MKDALSLSGGTTIAQLTAIATLPVLTRLYFPEEFGVLALYTAVASVLSVFASLKLEQAIMLSETDHEAAGILVALFVNSLAFALIVFIAILLCGDKLLEWIGRTEFKPWLYLLPVSVFLLGTYQGLRFWQMRQRNFRLVSIGLVSAILVSTVVSILIGILGKAFFLGAAGLVIGYVVQGLINMLILLKGTLNNQLCFQEMNRKHIIQSVIPHKKLISTLLVSHAISVGYSRIPIIAISGLFGSIILGYYSMAIRIVSAPTMLISKALGDVFRQRATVYWQKKGRFNDIFLKTLILTTAVGIPAYLMGIIIAPKLFPFVLGEDWIISGNYAQILLVAGMFQFVTVPVDKGAVIVGAHKFILLWNFIRLLGVIFSVGLVFIFQLNIYSTILLLSVNNIFAYLINVIFEYRFSSGQYIH